MKYIVLTKISVISSWVVLPHWADLRRTVRLRVAHLRFNVSGHWTWCRHVRFVKIHLAKKVSPRLLNLSVLKKWAFTLPGPVDCFCRQADGSLLVIIDHPPTIQMLFVLKSIDIVHVTTSVPDHLNCCRGIVQCLEVAYLSNDIIVVLLQGQADKQENCCLQQRAARLLSSSPPVAWNCPPSLFLGGTRSVSRPTSLVPAAASRVTSPLPVLLLLHLFVPSVLLLATMTRTVPLQLASVLLPVAGPTVPHLGNARFGSLSVRHQSCATPRTSTLLSVVSSSNWTWKVICASCIFCQASTYSDAKNRRRFQGHRLDNSRKKDETTRDNHLDHKCLCLRTNEEAVSRPAQHHLLKNNSPSSE